MGVLQLTLAISSCTYAFYGAALLGEKPSVCGALVLTAACVSVCMRASRGALRVLHGRATRRRASGAAFALWVLVTFALLGAATATGSEACLRRPRALCGIALAIYELLYLARRASPPPARPIAPVVTVNAAAMPYTIDLYTSDEREACCICLEDTGQRSAPCGHPICAACCKEYARHAAVASLLCPVCRQGLDLVLEDGV